MIKHEFAKTRRLVGWQEIRYTFRLIGLQARWFENVIQDNILFGMDEITVDDFLNSTKTCWAVSSLTAFLPVAVSRSCKSA